jgi:hypothetical protein
VVRNVRANRRVKLSWDSLEPGLARKLDRLARRVDGPGPIAFIDPAAVNLLAARQAAGQWDPGIAAAKLPWFALSSAGKVVESATVPGTYGFTTTTVADRVGWKQGKWTGFPVPPGMKDVTGAGVGSFSATGTTVTGTAPATAAFVTPHAAPGAIGTFALAGACLTYGGDTPAADLPGEGCPPVAITGYSDAPAQPLPYRGISLDLVEVASAAG